MSTTIRMHTATAYAKLIELLSVIELFTLQFTQWRFSSRNFIFNFSVAFLPERDYVTFGSLLSQFRLSSVCLSDVCLSSVVCRA